MCGIAGIWSQRAEALAPIGRMVDALRHRGPDDEGYLLADSTTGRHAAYGGPDTLAELALPELPATAPAGSDLALGHRRLAIIDLGPGGHGPMASADEGLWITYNGEIYNYIELREELARLGCSFRTVSDTEVLLAAYRHWGEASLHRLNGMWAFALYDSRQRKLFCARDRFGVKPFHYYWDGNLFAFASELPALLAHRDISGKPHWPVVARFLRGGAVDETEETFFEGIHRLPAGHQLTFDLEARRLQVRRWYELPRSEGGPLAAETFRGLVEDAVRLRLRSDVEVGTCLSGGLDSSSIVGLSARLRSGDSQGRYRAFSVIYDDAGLDESMYIGEVARTTGVHSSVATPTAAELWGDLSALSRHQGEPFPSASVYSQWRVMRLAGEAGVKVLLDGQGADEVLAGYHYHFGPFLAEIRARRGFSEALFEAREASRVTGKPLSFFVGLLGYHLLPLPARFREWALRHGSTHRTVPRSLLGPSLLALPEEPVARHRPRRSLGEERRANIWESSLPALLRYEDRNSMAFSVEARTPFLDYRLVEMAIQLPATALIRRGWTKAILRDAAKGIVPESVRLRRDKLGFPTPERRWLVELAPRVRRLLADSSLAGDVVDGRALDAWLSAPDEQLAARPGLFRLISLALWLRDFPGRSR